MSEILSDAKPPQGCCTWRSLKDSQECCSFLTGHPAEKTFKTSATPELVA